MITAITGTIGSGKSEVGRILRGLGKIVLDCDKINAELLKDDKYLSELEKLFPYAFSDGVFNKNVLSRQIFEDENERKKLNDLAHPYILKKLSEELNIYSGEDVFVEIPLLNDENSGLFDRVIVVVSDKDAKIGRITSRDKIFVEQAEKRLASQTERTDYNLPVIIIKNNSDKTDLENKVKNFIL